MSFYYGIRNTFEEKEVAKKYNQEPVIAPNVKPLNQTKVSSEGLDDKKKEPRYLFENIDQSLLKADEELLSQIYG